MKIKLMIIGITILIIFIILSVYYEVGNFRIYDEDRFVGRWIEIEKEMGTPTYAYFSSNGTFYGGYWPIGDIWELEDGKIMMSLSYGEGVYATYYYEFQENDTILKLTDLKSNNLFTFQKQ